MVTPRIGTPVVPLIKPKDVHFEGFDGVIHLAKYHPSPGVVVCPCGEYAIAAGYNAWRMNSQKPLTCFSCIAK